MDFETKKLRAFIVMARSLLFIFYIFCITTGNYIELAQVELTHVDKLHSIIVSLINKAKETRKVIPTGMLEIWDWQHKKIVEEVEELKFKINKFRN